MEWLADVTSDHTFLWPAMRLAGAMAAQGAAVQAYQFDWAPPASRFKACHCIELPFVFGNLDAWPGAGMLDGGDRTRDGGAVGTGPPRVDRFRAGRQCRGGLAGLSTGRAMDHAAGADNGAGTRSGRVALASPENEPAHVACSVACRMPGRHGSARRSKSPGTAHGTRRSDGPVGPQPLSRLRMAMGDFDLPQSEDCLSLTIFAPESAGPWPVILWLHGGAYLSGAGSLPVVRCRCAGRVRRGGRGSQLSPRAAGDAACAGRRSRGHAAAGHRGGADLGAGEYRGFGGDPGCVTLMGQSAGAHAIMCLLCRGSRGFHRAVLLSPPPAWAPLSEAEATERGRQFVAELGADPRERQCNVCWRHRGGCCGPWPGSGKSSCRSCRWWTG